jgi:hypothetical protein
MVSVVATVDFFSHKFMYFCPSSVLYNRNIFSQLKVVKIVYFSDTTAYERENKCCGTVDSRQAVFDWFRGGFPSSYFGNKEKVLFCDFFALSFVKN